ncbi:hypothetical protein STEG23_036926, partial [Scotinomys teguina]
FFLFMKMNVASRTDSTPHVSSQEKRKAKNNIKNIFHSTESPFIEQKYQKHSKKRENAAEDTPGEEDFSPSPWRLISSVLGVMCLLLMAVAIAMSISTTNLSSEKRCSRIQRKGLNHPCPENWVWFRCSCYYFSKEKLSWRESQHACLSLNSSLIRISKEEMDFFNLNSFFWVGIYYDETSRKWHWENHSVLLSEV